MKHQLRHALVEKHWLHGGQRCEWQIDDNEFAL